MLMRHVVIVVGTLAIAGCAQIKEMTGEKSEPATETAGAAPAADSNVQTVKSIDGSFEGEIIGGDPKPGSKFSKLKIGMRMAQVEKLIGEPDDSEGHITGKAFIPFFFGGDTHRVEQFYAGEGILTFSPAHFAGEPNILVAITVDPTEQGVAH